MNMHTKPTRLALLLPAALNPAVAAAIGIGLVGFGIYRLLGDDEECQKSEASPEPLSTVASTVEHLDSEGSQFVQESRLVDCSLHGLQNADLQQQDVVRDDVKKRMIREAMSELGKRSAAARARKKAEASASRTI